MFVAVVGPTGFVLAWAALVARLWMRDDLPSAAYFATVGLIVAHTWAGLLLRTAGLLARLRGSTGRMTASNLVPFAELGWWFPYAIFGAVTASSLSRTPAVALTMVLPGLAAGALIGLAAGRLWPLPDVGRPDMLATRNGQFSQVVTDRGDGWTE
jgi:hypothetical protein